MPVAALAHPVLSGLLADEEVAQLLSPEAEIRAMLAVEAASARAEADVGIIPQDAAERVAEAVACSQN